MIKIDATSFFPMLFWVSFVALGAITHLTA